MRYAIVPLAALLLTGCSKTQEEIANGDDPIAALEATMPSARYTDAYWMQQAETTPARYAEAVQVCEGADLGERPNCATVASAKWTVETMEREEKSRNAIRDYLHSEHEKAKANLP